MKTIILAATAALALASSAMAATPSGSFMKPQPVSVSTETCSSAKVKFEAAEKAHAKSPNLVKARTEAKTAAADCKSGKSAAGVSSYNDAIKLLTT